MEAAIGFEPMNEGFADLCLSHLATPPVSYAFEVESGEQGVDRLTGSWKSYDKNTVAPNSVL
jgi:hypothetical protein